MSRKHITSEQRNELSFLLKVRTKKKDIARQLGKDRTTIWRELNRNKTVNKQGYDARIAKLKTKQRRIIANQRFKKLSNNAWLRQYVVTKLKKYWSPEQIAGRLKTDYPNDKIKHISKDSIYQHIYHYRKDLVKYLRCQKGKYRRRYGTRIREKQREELKKSRIDIRPRVVELRKRVGDWEGDTIVGKERKIHILTHVDRKSGLLLGDKLAHANAELTKQKTIARFSNIPKNKKYTITYDNGTTFSQHELIAKKTKLAIYFAHPYHAWEKGCNENANGLLRQFFPKKSSFANITQEDIKKAIKLINNRPRKRLNYQTPTEVFYQS